MVITQNNTTSKTDDNFTDINNLSMLADACVKVSNENHNEINEPINNAKPPITLREAIYEIALEKKTHFTIDEMLYEIKKKNLYNFGKCKTPKASVGSVLSREISKYKRISNATYKLNANEKIIVNGNIHPKKHISHFTPKNQNDSKKKRPLWKLPELIPKPPDLDQNMFHMYMNTFHNYFNTFQVMQNL